MARREKRVYGWATFIGGILLPVGLWLIYFPLITDLFWKGAVSVIFFVITIASLLMSLTGLYAGVMGKTEASNGKA